MGASTYFMSQLGKQVPAHEHEYEDKSVAVIHDTAVRPGRINKARMTVQVCRFCGLPRK